MEPTDTEKSQEENMLQIIRILMVLMLTVKLSACATGHQGSMERFQGHWTTGIAYSYFTLLDGSKSYWMVDDDVPYDAVELMRDQPVHRDPFSNTGNCQAIYLDILGVIEEDRSSAPEMKYRLHINKILRMGPATSDFFVSSRHPLPERKIGRP